MSATLVLSLYRAFWYL